jgi:Ca-activated chloride channel family protein
MKVPSRGLAAALCLGVCGAFAADTPAPALRITSPLGRTGLPGTIRIVARLDHLRADAPVDVHFYVDRLFLSSDTDGPPYEATWDDDNPFERRELTAQADLGGGRRLSSTVVLKPLQVTEAAEVNSVALEAAVLDEKGRFVRNLTAADVELVEDREPQVIDAFEQRREPALFAVLVDSSQSMALRAGVLRTTAARLLDPLSPDDQVLVAPFSRRILTVTGPTTDRHTVLRAIAAIAPEGGTAILDALQEAASSLAGDLRRRAIVLVTDGYDEHSTVEIDATVDALRRSDITLYVIGVGGVAGISLKGEALLRSLAERTGGRAWFPLDPRQLAMAYEAVAADVQHRYFITYTPRNQRRDGTYRTITLRPRVPSWKVRAREGYVAPMAPPIRASLEFTAIGSGQTPVSLTREDLVVLEDGVPQEVDTFHDSVLPVTIMLALDASGSMKRSAAQAQEAAREFVRALRPEDELGMILFANASTYVHSPTGRRDWSLEAIDGYVAEGGTALYDALYDSLAQIADVKGRRVVVVVTDGRDENAASTGPGSLRTWDDVLRKLRESEATVYPVGIGSRVDRERLQELADRSGGSAFFPADVTTLAADYHKILDELRRRYVVGYLSTNRLRDGGWRTVTIRVRGGDVTVRSRGGYSAPREP